MLANAQYRILKGFWPKSPDCCSGQAYQGKSKLEVLLGEACIRAISGKTVIDFGCGEGLESVEMALAGAKRVIGLDIREEILRTARQVALSAGVQDICSFATSTEEPVDIIVSLDAFEHFRDPGETLSIMHSLLRPGGEVFVSFGPTWYHPLGGHLFSVFPWAHLIFTENALIRWRSDFKADGATRFNEVAGGLNQMTINKFQKLIKASAFRLASIEFVPIKRLRFLHSHLTREFTTAIVRCCLLKEM